MREGERDTVYQGLIVELMCYYLISTFFLKPNQSYERG